MIPKYNRPKQMQQTAPTEFCHRHASTYLRGPIVTRAGLAALAGLLVVAGSTDCLSRSVVWHDCLFDQADLEHAYLRCELTVFPSESMALCNEVAPLDHERVILKHWMTWMVVPLV